MLKSEQRPGWGMPFHPACMSLLQKLHRDRLGSPDIDWLYELWFCNAGGSPRHPDYLSAYRKPHEHTCRAGAEYLAVNPYHVPKLTALVAECTRSDGLVSSDVFDGIGPNQGSTTDIFTTLPPELRLMVLTHMERADVANLRRASRHFCQLPQQYFRHLVRAEMPWVWEADAVVHGLVDWYKLWCALSAADGGRRRDERDREELRRNKLL